MEKITAVTRDTARVVGEELRAAVADIAAKHGLTVRPSKLIYDPMSGTIRLPVELVTDAGAATDATLLGLPADIIGRHFTTGGERYKVIGLNPRRPKYCVSVERCRDGHKMAFASGVSRLLEPSATTAPAVDPDAPRPFTVIPEEA